MQDATHRRLRNAERGEATHEVSDLSGAILGILLPDLDHALPPRVLPRLRLLFDLSWRRQQSVNATGPVPLHPVHERRVGNAEDLLDPLIAKSLVDDSSCGLDPYVDRPALSRRRFSSVCSLPSHVSLLSGDCVGEIGARVLGEFQIARMRINWRAGHRCRVRAFGGLRRHAGGADRAAERGTGSRRTTASAGQANERKCYEYPSHAASHFDAVGSSHTQRIEVTRTKWRNC